MATTLAPDTSRDAAVRLAQQQYDMVRSNADLTADAKTRLIAQAYVKLRDTIKRIDDAEAASVRAETDRLAHNLYGLPDGADSLSYRDALQRVSSIAATDTNSISDVQDKLADLLEQARITHDDLLARAVLKRAYDQRLPNLVNAWSSANTTKEADADRLWDLTGQADMRNVIGRAFNSPTALPPELNRMSTFDLDKLATSE